MCTVSLFALLMVETHSLACWRAAFLSAAINTLLMNVPRIVASNCFMCFVFDRSNVHAHKSTKQVNSGERLQEMMDGICAQEIAQREGKPHICVCYSNIAVRA